MVPVAWLLTSSSLCVHDSSAGQEVTQCHEVTHTLCHPPFCCHSIRFSSNALIINYCSSWSILFNAHVAMRDSPHSSCKVHLNFISSHKTPRPMTLSTLKSMNRMLPLTCTHATAVPMKFHFVQTVTAGRCDSFEGELPTRAGLWKLVFEIHSL